VPWDWSGTSTYVTDPNDGSNPWVCNTLFSVGRPISAPVALSIDHYNNTWVYFGTGRYISQDDKTDTNTQYLFGLVDPFFNSYYDTAPNDYYRNYTKSLELDINDLFAADPYMITSSGGIWESGTYFGVWGDLLNEARTYDGWYRTLDTSKERAVTKFTVLGGIVFAPTFIPSQDICGFGGNSNLYALFYETGTAFYRSVLGDDVETVLILGDNMEKVKGKISLGFGKASSLGIHVGQEEGAKAFIQQSTGTVLNIDADPAFKVKSGLINWRQK
jgi:type IV pilus assembly protein PilY1